MLSDWLTTIGLICDAVGVIVVFALAASIVTGLELLGPGMYEDEEGDEARSARKWMHLIRWARYGGLGLILLGFGLQIAAVWV